MGSGDEGGAGVRHVQGGVGKTATGEPQRRGEGRGWVRVVRVGARARPGAASACLAAELRVGARWESERLKSSEGWELKVATGRRRASRGGRDGKGPKHGDGAEFELRALEL
ncbi:uncharacterized protein A4U43_C05F12360 [Asparagus officinalis]|uniref:Uncharacterized protein n=1 Tax=Asparagus officinalis TaxID=4686 RepID=A0A5P1EUV6_ASPOF|nr:uncharacterized protein A4U43_C05F12360 [Asparagus officinalis]